MWSGRSVYYYYDVLLLLVLFTLVLLALPLTEAALAVAIVVAATAAAVTLAELPPLDDVMSIGFVLPPIELVAVEFAVELVAMAFAAEVPLTDAVPLLAVELPTLTAEQMNR